MNDTDALTEVGADLCNNEAIQGRGHPGYCYAHHAEVDWTGHANASDVPCRRAVAIVERIVAARVAADRAAALAQAEANLLALADREDYDPWAKAIIGNDAIHALRAAVAVPEPEEGP